MKTSTLELLSQKGLKIGLCSWGISNRIAIEKFLPTSDASFHWVWRDADFDLYIGWGNRPSGRKAVRLANRANKPFLLIEDAFIRSVAPRSVSGEASLGLIMDDEGIYLDASRPSALERLIRHQCSLPENQQTGALLIQHLKNLKISKYNNFTPVTNLQLTAENSSGVLVVDQTFNDQSVTGAGADSRSFEAMIQAAIDENPGERISVKIHPEVIAGRKKGYLKQLADKYDLEILAQNLNPWDLPQMFHKLYTVSSQLGFDALLAGLEVRCFGMPFYAGWGLTTDETICKRRSQYKPTIDNLATAALEKYASYIDPYDACPSDAFKTASNIAFIRDIKQQNDEIASFYQITAWKKQRIRQMFKPGDSSRIFFNDPDKAIDIAQKKNGRLVAWASRIDDEFAQQCAKNSVPLSRLEDGFVRSVGLGAAFNLPMSLILDDLGIYYDPRRPSRLEVILQTQDFSEHLKQRARTLIRLLIENEITKYNLAGSSQLPEMPDDKNIILVPGQVDDDASIRFGGESMTALDLLKQVRAKNPDAHIIFKPHPDVLSGLRKGLSNPGKALEYADCYIENIPVEQLVMLSNEVHTISSLTGFEALLRNRKVCCYGMPFFAGWGLTEDFRTCKRRNRSLTLEQLVAGTLITYPRYFDPVSKLPCGPELVVKRIMQQKARSPNPSVLTRFRTSYGNIAKMLRR